MSRIDQGSHITMSQAVPRRKLAILAATGSAIALTGFGTVTALAAPTATSTTASTSASADATAPTGVDRSSAIVQLSLKPLATDPLTAPRHGKKLAWGSSAVKNERAKLSAQRNQFKKWLADVAPRARVTGEYDVAVNAVAVRLNGASLTTLRTGPNVVSASYQARYAPTAEDPDLSMINAFAGWTAAAPAGGPSNAGTGIKVGVVDAGIDTTHPCFGDTGFPATTQRGDTRFTNNKVIVAKVFYDHANGGGLTAEAIGEHGTHVAGTIACDYQTPAVVNGTPIDYDPSGVAPGAQLGSYNVFPGEVADARSEDILDALQAAAQDGMDVINMSLGGDSHGVQDLLTTAVDNLDRANIVVAISAGNNGPGAMTIGSPGMAERALTAGAATVGHFIGLPISANGAQVVVAATSDFAPVGEDITGTLVPSGSAAALGNGCAAGSYTGLAGNIALVARGTCSFSQKVFNAEQDGATAVIVVNNVGGDPISMGQDGVFTTTIPAVQAGLGDKAALTALAGQQVTVGSTADYVITGNDNIMAGFSSMGPVDVSFRVKPDVVAPGVNVLSSIPHNHCETPPCWAFFQGTSMASPHLAGTAAVVRQAHPSWDAWQVRSAIANTAVEGVLKNVAASALETNAQKIGAGLEDVEAAVNAQLALSSVSTSFGAVPAGNGSTMARTVTVANLTASAITVPVSITGTDAALFGASTGSLTVPASGTATLTVSFDPRAATHGGGNQATLRLGDVAHSVLYAFVK